MLVSPKAPPEVREQVREELGLNRPILEQYVSFITNAFKGDFGKSYIYKVDALSLIAQRVPATLELVFVSAVLALGISIPLGVYAGAFPKRKSSTLVMGGSILGISLPSFFIGIMLIYIFSLKLHWFPISGWGDTFGEHVWSLILPAFTQSLGISALLIRNMQNEVAQIFTIDYVDFARSKGLAPMRVRVWYILRNVMISTTTLFSIGIASMLGGSVIIETVFSLPGLGSLIMSSILARDYPAVQGCVILFAVIIMAVNLLTDILYSVLDPRVKLQ